MDTEVKDPTTEYEQQSSALSVLCDYIRKATEDNKSLLKALVKTLDEWVSVPEEFPVPGYYEVTAVVKEFPHRNRTFKNVSLSLFKNGATIEDMKKIQSLTPYQGDDDPYNLYQFDMMFTLEETMQLIEWLSNMKGTSINVRPAIALENGNSVSAVAVGGGTDFYMLHEMDNYTLPFKVEGYFDVRENEIVYKPQEDEIPF